MLKDAKVFSSFSVDDLRAAQTFYGETLGLNVEERPEGLAYIWPGIPTFSSTSRRITSLRSTRSSTSSCPMWTPPWIIWPNEGFR